MRFCLPLCLLVAFAGSARAYDPPKPEVKNSTLRIVQEGQKTTFTLYGDNLAPKETAVGKPLQVKLLGVKPTERDFKARGSQQLEVQVIAPVPCPPGSYDLTLTYPDKTTLSLPIAVLPTTAHRSEAKKPNNSFRQAVPLRSPSAEITGSVERDAYAFFSFEAKAGETWEVTLIAGRVGSELDALLRLRDRSHHTLALAAGQSRKDRRILFRAPIAGTYFLELSDADNRGGPTFTYALILQPKATRG